MLLLKPVFAGVGLERARFSILRTRGPLYESKTLFPYPISVRVIGVEKCYWVVAHGYVKRCVTLQLVISLVVPRLPFPIHLEVSGVDTPYQYIGPSDEMHRYGVATTLYFWTTWLWHI